MKILDEKTLQFIMPEPFAPFLDYLSFGVLPKHILEVCRLRRWSTRISTWPRLAAVPSSLTGCW